jgi:acyl-CoA thioesterase I
MAVLLTRRFFTVIFSIFLLLNLRCTSNPMLNDSCLLLLKKILPIGDSITQGSIGHDSYRRPLWKMIDSAGYKVDFIGSTRLNYEGFLPSDTTFDMDHEGHSGFCAHQLADSLPLWLKKYAPDVVLLHAGTNDISAGERVSEIVSDIDRLIRVLRTTNGNVVVLLALLIPCSSYDIDSINNGLSNLAQSRTSVISPVVIVDQNRGFVSALDSYDEVHPNSYGEIKMARKWFSLLEQYLIK